MFDPEDMRQPEQSPERSGLADLSAIHIREDLPHAEKVQAFLSDIENPYCFRCGDVPVNVRFTGGGPTLGSALQSFFSRIKQG